MLRPYRTRADEDARFGSTILSKSCTCFAKQDPTTLTSSIFHHYSASPKYIHNLYFLIAEPTEEQYLPIQVLDTLADPSANLTELAADKPFLKC